MNTFGHPVDTRHGWGLMTPCTPLTARPGPAMTDVSRHDHLVWRRRTHNILDPLIRRPSRFGLGWQMSRLEAATGDGARAAAITTNPAIAHHSTGVHRKAPTAPVMISARPATYSTAETTRTRGSARPGRSVSSMPSSRSRGTDNRPRNHHRLDSSRIMPERANRGNPAPVRAAQARTAFARPSSAACSMLVRSGPVASPAAECASVRASGRYRRNAASSRSATNRRDRPARA